MGTGDYKLEVILKKVHLISGDFLDWIWFRDHALGDKELRRKFTENGLAFFLVLLKM